MPLERLAEAAQVHVSRETWALMERYMAMILDENQRQNLIGKRTEKELFERHIVDGAQLLPVAGVRKAEWIDIGTGPGLPGIVLAILDPVSKFTLVEPRPLRIAFLDRVVSELRLGDRVTLVEGKAADVHGSFQVITGRAVANISKFLRMSEHLSTEKSVWVLPKGKKAVDELEEARRFWHFEASSIRSLTDDDATIVRIERARQRARGGKR